MKILVYESCDKTQRIIRDMSKEEILKLLEEDNGLIEAISTHDSRILVRLFFDIDGYDIKNDPLNNSLDILCSFFKCTKDEWAIATSNRDDKFSYHIVSRTKCSTLRTLRDITQRLSWISDVFDPRMLCCSITDPYECIYFRLPNQTKRVINKNSPSLEILVGSIDDFIISDVRQLHIIKL